MPDQRIDLRSDTTTKPTPEMRRVMFEAEVGDDGFGDSGVRCVTHLGIDDEDIERTVEAFGEVINKS